MTTETRTEKEAKCSFPIEGSDRCPSCGCEERIGRQLLDQMKAEGKLQKTAYPKGFVIKVPLFQVLAAPLVVKQEIPVVEITFDVCKECKTLYCTNFDLTAMPYETNTQAAAGR
jgi:hypothetical protein